MKFIGNLEDLNNSIIPAGWNGQILQQDAGRNLAEGGNMEPTKLDVKGAVIHIGLLFIGQLDGVQLKCCREEHFTSPS